MSNINKLPIHTANIITGFTSNIYILTGTSITIDFTKSHMQKLTVSGNLTINASSTTGTCQVYMTVDNNGPYTITPNTGVTLFGASTLLAGTKYILEIVKISTSNTILNCIQVTADGYYQVPPASQFTRPYGDAAAWNLIATSYDTHSNSTALVNTLWNAGTPGNWNLIGFDSTDYSLPLYRVADSDATYTVNCTYGNMDGQSIPWNALWQLAADPQSDKEFILIDETTGYEYNGWQAVADVGLQELNCTRCSLVQASVSEDTGNPGDYRIKESGYRPSRGVGIQYYAMLVTPEEIANGIIEHALSMGMPVPDSVIYYNPATKLEGNGLPDQVPEGTRFRGLWTDANITAWTDSISSRILSNGGTQTTADAVVNFATIIAVALRDYGWFITDTSGGTTMRFESVLSAQSKWEGLNLPINVNYGGKVYPRDLLDGLITSSNFIAVDGTAYYPPNHDVFMLMADDAHLTFTGSTASFDGIFNYTLLASSSGYSFMGENAELTPIDHMFHESSYSFTGEDATFLVV